LGEPVFAYKNVVKSNSNQTVHKTGAYQLTSRAKVNTRGIDIVRLNMLPRLPETASELIHLAKALGADPAKDVFLRSRANEKTVKSMNLAQRKVIAFATHGLVPGDLNGLTEPALAMSSHLDNKNSEDGLLTTGEIMGLKLNADWVILSACNTAVAEGEGAEALSGLCQAFFYSGARAILATSWSVESTSATALTTGLFRGQNEKTMAHKAENLRISKIRMIDELGIVNQKTNKTVAAYSHPFFWAPFILIGKGG